MYSDWVEHGSARPPQRRLTQLTTATYPVAHLAARRAWRAVASYAQLAGLKPVGCCLLFILPEMTRESQF